MNGVNSSPPQCRRSQRRIAAAPSTQRSHMPQSTEPLKRYSPSVEAAAHVAGYLRVVQRPARPNQAATKGVARQSAVPHALAQSVAPELNQRLSTLVLSVEPHPPHGSALRRVGSPVRLSSASRGSPRAFKNRA